MRPNIVEMWASLHSLSLFLCHTHTHTRTHFLLIFIYANESNFVSIKRESTRKGISIFIYFIYDDKMVENTENTKLKKRRKSKWKRALFYVIGHNRRTQYV